jgi:hypothetical protein
MQVQGNKAKILHERMKRVAATVVRVMHCSVFYLPVQTTTLRTTRSQCRSKIHGAAAFAFLRAIYPVYMTI